MAASDAMDSMYVEFLADYSSLDSATGNISAIFADISSAAEESSAAISESLAGAADSFSVLDEAGTSSIDMIIELLDQIAVNTTGVTEAISTMSEEVTSGLDSVASSVDMLDSSFVNLSAEATASSEAVASAGASAESAGSDGFGGLFTKVGMGIFTFQAMGTMATQLGKSLLGPAVSAETVTTALTTLDGSAQAAQAEMARLNEFAAKTPFKTLDIDQAAEELQGFGLKAQDVVPDITAIGDALGSVGRDTPAELDSVVQIFGKIHTEGKITQMTMNELAVHGINGWQALADATGKSIPQVKELVKKGLIPADTAIQDLTKGIEMNPLYKGGMAKAAGTFTGLMSTLQSNFQQVLASFGSPIIKALEGQLNNLGTLFASPSFQKFAGSVGQGIVNAFKGIGSVVGPLLNNLKPLGGMFASAFGGISNTLNSLGSNTAVQGFMTTLGNTFKQVSSIVGGTLQANFKTFSGIIQDLGKWWSTTMWPAIQSALPGFEHLGSVVLTTVVPALAKIWSVGQQVMRDVLPPLTKAFETVAPIVVKVGGFIADNLGKALQFIMPYLVQAAQAVGQFASDILSRAIPVVQQIWTGLMDFLNWLQPIWPPVWQAIQTVFTSTWDVIKGAIQIAWSIVSGIIKVGLDLLSGNWGKAWDDIKSMFSGVWDGIKSIAAGIWNLVSTPIMNGIHSFQNTWNSIWNAVKSTFSNIWNSLTGIVQGVWNGIGGAIKSGINWVIGLINDFINGINSIGIDIGSVHIHPHIPDIPYLATGGFVAPGSVAVAGDQGPELVFGGSSGAHVLSNAQSQALAGSGGSKQPVNIYLVVNGQTIAAAMLPDLANGIINATRSGHPVGSVA